MKNVLLLILVSGMVIACGTQEKASISEAKKDANQNGYTVAKSSNIDLVKKFNELAIQYDTAAISAMYSSRQDTIHDNLTNMTVSENLQSISKLKAANIKISIKNYGALWETINDEASPKGVKNYVIAYILMNLNNGKQNRDIIMNQVCAIKDGKIVEEWDIYDTKAIEEFLK
ncbi:hypothetical protein [Aquirufa rosea]|uniref:Nuclear transport factor 2 family protein n=1 Tax=Aquirufa rosea TaxID=2509241 RepID=A0A4Q1BXB0_9BACT|nr:hypothetical protein [Aquirufa rosea]RXK46534.1 hypothetical protein ESB04_11970 [Aquirufa rosea]